MQRCLLGAVLMKFGQALVVTWGKANIYFYSYYKLTEPDLSIQYNILPVAIVALPLSVLSVISLRIAKRIGHHNLLRITSVIQTVSLMISPLMPTYWSFILFYLVIFGFSFALSVFTILNCVYSYYPQSEGKVSGYLMGVYSLGILVFELVLTYISNPNNQEATLQGSTGKSNFHYFDISVAENVPKAVWVAAAISSSAVLLGSLLVQYNKPQTILPEANQNQNDIQEIEMQTKSEPSDEKVAEQQNQQDTITTTTNHQSPQLYERKAALSYPFLAVFFPFMCLYFIVVSLSTNYKSYGLTKVNDDFFITFVDMLCQVVGGIFSLMWGYITDRFAFNKVYAGVEAGAAVFVILFALTNGRVCFVVFLLLYQIFLKGAILSTGPGIVKIFKNELGTKLLTYLNFSYLLAFLISPIMQFFLNKVIEMDYILVIYALLVLLQVPLILRMPLSYM